MVLMQESWTEPAVEKVNGESVQKELVFMEAKIGPWQKKA